MLALARYDAAPTEVLFPSERAELAWLRIAGARCRVMRRTDLFEACAVLSMSGEEAAHSYAQTLFRALPGLLPNGLTLYRPGDTDISFDEAWLLQLIAQERAGNRDSVSFLIQRRLPRYAWYQVRFLISALVRTLDDA